MLRINVIKIIPSYLKETVNYCHFDKYYFYETLTVPFNVMFYGTYENYTLQ